MYPNVSNAYAIARRYAFAWVGPRDRVGVCETPTR